MSCSLLEKYKPTTLSQILGNKTVVQSLGTWLQTWPAVSTCALVSGPCGVGKTLTLELLIHAPTANYNVLEINPDDERNDTFFHKHVKPFVKTKKNIWGKDNLLLVNDVDVANDHGFLGALCTCIKETKIPILLTCNERYDPKLKTLAALCTDFKYFSPSALDICKYVTEMVKKELDTPRLAPGQLQLIQMATETAQGDVRNAILNTEFQLLSVTTSTTSASSNTTKPTHTNHTSNSCNKDKRTANLFELTTSFLSQFTDLTDKMELFAMEKELLPLMVHENYPANLLKTKTPVEKLNHLSFAAAKLSDADLFPYDYGSTSILQATNVCHVTAKVNFTSYLGKMSTKIKKTNVSTDLESHLRGLSPRLPIGHFRLDYLCYMAQILYRLLSDPVRFVDKSIAFGFTKEDIQENLGVLLLAEGTYASCDYAAIDKKVKAALTKQFNKHALEASSATVEGGGGRGGVESTPPAKKTKTTKKATSPSATATATSVTPTATTTTTPATEKKKTAPRKTTTTTTTTKKTSKTTECLVSLTRTPRTLTPEPPPAALTTAPPVVESTSPPTLPTTRTTVRKKTKVTSTPPASATV